MGVELIRATQADEEVLKHLFQFYIYDFSEYMPIEVEGNGKYDDYPLAAYWVNPAYFPYLIKKGVHYIGFVLVKESRTHTSIAEFFIMKRHRRGGFGKAIVHKIFHQHRGNWEISQLKNNEPARLFGAE
ncbi:hypothetical protein JCM19046_142 [Bacillus sp. JCM 19046]|nr:hypothetical protein JCM19046_142 [Bacillus sp. JCM 19046]